MKSYFFYIFLIVIFCTPSLVVGLSPWNPRYTIAVTKFRDTNGRSTHSKISKLLKKDLNLVDIFDVVDGERDEADAIIQGIVNTSQDSLILKLIDTKSHQILLENKYSIKNDYSSAIHHFMDDLMKKLTGSSGPFSSQITALCENNKVVVMNIDGTGRKVMNDNYLNREALAWSPDRSKAIFSSDKSGKNHLFLIDTRKKSISQLTYVGDQNVEPDWSPDGKLITFSMKQSGDYDIFLMKPDGSQILKLTLEYSNEKSPSWSPDGRYISFSSDRPDSPGIYIMNTNGDNKTLIPHTSSCMNPNWGPRL